MPYTVCVLWRVVYIHEEENLRKDLENPVRLTLTGAPTNFSSKVQVRWKNTQLLAGQILIDSHCIGSGQKF